MSTKPDFATTAGPDSQKMPTSPLRRKTLWLDILIFVVLAAISLVTGFLAVQTTTYWSEAQVFQDFMNSSLRILFPVAVALSAGLITAEQLSNRFVVNTRTRTDVRRWVAGKFWSAAIRAFVIFALITVVNAVAAFFIVPELWPHILDPAGYGLDDATAIANANVSVAPLAAFAQFGLPVFILVAAAWFGLNAAAFALVTVLAVFFIRRTVLALMVPLILYLAESLFFQLQGMPAPAFLISAVYPSGLQDYDLVVAAIPTAVLLVTAAMGALVFVSRSRTSPRLS